MDMTRVEQNTTLKPFVLWLTGLSGSGKSTIADKLYEEFSQINCELEKLDGDVMRGVFPATGFTRESRDEHIKRVGFMASLLEKHGVIVIASFISPYREARSFVRQLCQHFVEVYVNVSFEECERRDVKGLYKKARAGEITHFTGLDDPYEPPENPEIIVNTEQETVDESVKKIMDYLHQHFSGNH